MLFDQPEWEYAPQTPAERFLLLAKWNEVAPSLLERDGTQTDRQGKVFHNAHRIKQNPVLIAAIQDIRDEYYQLFDEWRALKEGSAIPDLLDKLSNNERDRAALSHRSYLRLAERNYGFTDEQAQNIAANAGIESRDPPEGLRNNDALYVLGAIIGRAVRSYNAVFENGNYRGRVGVSDISPVFPAEYHKRFRTVDRTSIFVPPEQFGPSHAVTRIMNEFSKQGRDSARIV